MTRVSIVSINYAPERTGIGVYTTGMAEHLAAEGHDVVVHTGFAYYPDWRKQPADIGKPFRREVVNGVQLRRCYLYVPARPSAITRILHEFSFVVSASLSYLFARKADRTIIILPPLALGAVIGVLGRIKKSYTILHVQDLQPDAAVELGMLRPGMLTRVLYALERFNYRIVDRISTISEGMRRRIVEKRVPVEKTFLFRNWANDTHVRPMDRMTALRAEWGLSEKHFVVLYSGNLGRKQGLESLLLAASHLRDVPEVRVVIVGNGAEQADLVRKALDMDLQNVTFQPLQPMERLSELLATADVSVIPQKRAVTDIVLPSKLCNILASARPVVAAAPPESDLALILREADCGILVTPEDGVQLADGIRRLLIDKDLRSKTSRNARAYAECHLSERSVMQKFSDDAIAPRGHG